MHELLTAYLHALHLLRRGRLPAAAAMDHAFDLLAAERKGRRAVGRLFAPYRSDGSEPTGEPTSAPTSEPTVEPGGGATGSSRA